MKKCLVVGAAMLDIIMEIGSLPKSGDDVIASTQEITVGGCAFNVATVLKSMEVPYSLLAPTGDGPYGNIVSSQLVWAGHPSPLMTKKGDNGYCLCLVEDSGERTFITYPGVESNFEYEWFSNIDVSEYDSIYICGYEMLHGDAVVRFCEAHPNLDIYYAPSPRITHINTEIHERVFALQPVVHLNESEALSYTLAGSVEEAAAYFYSRTQNTVIITLGSRGAFYMSNCGQGYIESIPTTVADTIGAGDSHIATYIGSRKLGQNIIDSICNANLVASTMVATKGATIAQDDFDKINLIR